MTAALIAKATAFIRRKRARRVYSEISGAIVGIGEELCATRAPESRADLLYWAAGTELRLAFKHDGAWGPALTEESRGRSKAHASSSRLLQMLAVTERAAADPDEASPVIFWSIDGGATVDEVALWERLAATRDHGERAELIAQLAELAKPRVGVEAAQLLINLGHDTEKKLAEGGPAPKEPSADLRKPTVVAAGLLVLLAVYAIRATAPCIYLHLK